MVRCDHFSNRAKSVRLRITEILFFVFDKTFPIIMQKRFYLIIVISFLIFQESYAAEVDSITPRKVQLENSLASVNEIINQRIEEGIEKANGKLDDFADMDPDEFCDEQILYTELRKAIFQSLTASWGLKGFALDKQLRTLLAGQSYSLSLKDSIYRDINYLEGFSLNMKELSDVVAINDHLVGVDKLGHFFAEGWRYFELTDQDGKTIEQALKWGKEQEVGKFGYATTGIFSFADLAANFNGWRFWNKVLLKKDDPLKGGIANFFARPYVTCERQFTDSIKYSKRVRTWQFSHRFDLSEYLDGSWDEGNNCNSYNDPIIEEKVALRIKRADPDFTCPVNPNICLQSQKKYDGYAKYVLHPFCLTARK